LVAWEDARVPANSIDIYIARLTPPGQVLDDAGIRVASQPTYEYQPSVAAGAGRFLVSWRGDTANDGADVFAVLASVDAGTLNVSPPISVAVGARNESAPRVAFDGTDFLAVWGDENSPSPDVRGTRVSVQGLVETPDGGELISGSDFTEEAPNLSVAGPRRALVLYSGYDSTARTLRIRARPWGDPVTSP